MWHCLGVLTYVDPSNVLRLQLGQFRPIGTYYTVAPVQMADMRAESGGHVVTVGRRLYRCRREGTGVARRAERKGFPVLCVCAFAWLELSLVGLSPNHVRVYTAGPGFLLFVAVFVCMDSLEDRIRR